MHVVPVENLEKDLAKTIADSGKEVLLLLSGGSQIARVPRMLEQFNQNRVRYSQLSIGLADERFASVPNHPASNFFQLTEIPGFVEIKNQGAELVPVLEGDQNLVSAGEKLSRLLESDCDDDSKITIAVIGVGLNGHIMGILPHDPRFSSMFYGPAAVGYDADKVAAAADDYRLRVTITFAGLAKIDKIIVYAIGEPKRQTLQRVINQVRPATMEEIAQFPALYLAGMTNVTLYTDLTLSV